MSQKLPGVRCGSLTGDDEALDRFLANICADEYETAVLEEFHQHLPEKPPGRG